MQFLYLSRPVEHTVITKIAIKELSSALLCRSQLNVSVAMAHRTMGPGKFAVKRLALAVTGLLASAWPLSVRGKKLSRLFSAYILTTLFFHPRVPSTPVCEIFFSFTFQ